jgi:D-alanyl-D-alanine carboxypeptidase (penicillin-binding protein 5/6)
VAQIPVAMLYDMSSGQTLYARNPDLRFVPASVTKVMTAYTAFGLMAQGKLNPQQDFTIDEATARQWRGQGTSLYLDGGSQVPVDLLLRGITTVSANDAAITLAQGYAGSVPAWAGLMNAQARALGMSNSHFGTPNGWPDGGATFVSARDLVSLGEALVERYPEQYHHYFGQKQLTWNGRTQFNKDPITGVVAGADGIKTGHTAEAGFNFLGSAERGGRRLMMVIAGAKSEEERASASRALLEWGFAAWTARPLFAKGAIVGQARVQEGDARQVQLRTSRTVSATLASGEAGPIALRILYRGPLRAPVAAGSEVAELEVRSGSGIGHVPLFAAQAVGKAGVFDRLVNGLAGLWP